MTMTTVPRTGEIDIAGFAQRHRESIATRAHRISLPPGLLVLSDVPYDRTAPVGTLAPLERYMRALETTANTTGVSTEVLDNLGHIAAEAALKQVAIDPTTHGVLVTLPLSISDPSERGLQTQKLLGLIPTDKDVDGLRPGGMPATAEAAQMLLESIREGRDMTVHVRGGRGHVGSGLIRLLESLDYRKVTSSDIDTPPHIQRQLLGEADVAYSATGQAEDLGPDDFGRFSDDKKTLINIGRGTTPDGRTAGDFSPALIAVAEERGWDYTNSGIGVGRLATLTVMGRVVDVAEAA